ncbi:hypothetical protein [Streptantibioticus cattleyicolor]|uniref:Uncharacterized protein n=1 Tax=Streptantibioticus cattleyicolor (strain ATCC 35852 / DSM 46488 / JCM 4925 / NBRC 14057 / NRRL 8057) TaxID=1003195 RepID=F8JJX7_STREN|nr:hypothetical protein [Streptantibioticus cattleyicolor]AEW98591.1 hypothetical protein SCATT_p03980 [Streptantibioticus cattleyicolor NRRL 8057 = DSM 46488]CCB72349.1 exported protein of unknown function [Streptantibioticus cattleyicolor NRRL 8057 = DSM 46488]
MHRLFRTVIAVLAGGALAVPLAAGPATAASGQFTWRGPAGKGYYVSNPPDGKCLAMAQSASGAHNGTRGPATVYADKGCAGARHRLAPGQDAPGSFAFRSVRFGA